MPNKFYVTTSIAYTNAPPHIGFALELCQADVLARWHGLEGDARFFLTGTDEHGRKNLEAAQGADLEPKKYVDAMSAKFRELARSLDISHDDFIRTSDRERHWPGVEAFWRRLADAGDLRKGQYKGLYCVGCEAFKKLSDLKDGRCPDHGTAPEAIEEENWFFHLSRYQDELLGLIEKGELHIVPSERRNEVLSFIRQGLEDVSFSRPRKDLPWGIPVPGDESQTIYVWADALPNYLTALGFGRGDDERFRTFWPADVHAIGKDILRFHAVIWPAMLLSAKFPLPKTLLVHGHILSGGQKMSKTKGNVVDPFALIERYGADAVRWYLLKEIPTTGDGDFTEARFREIYEGELVNGLGNLLSRVVAVAEKAGEPITLRGHRIREEIASAWKSHRAALEAFRLDRALASVFDLVLYGNRLVEERRPWEKENWREALPDLLILLGNAAWILVPFLPKTAREMFIQLGIDPRDTTPWEERTLRPKKGEPLFPRI